MKIINYRNFRFNKRNSPEFKHLKYLLYWPVYGLFFIILERFWIRENYIQIHCAADDLIPFCEYFLIPYLFWFIFLFGNTVYTLLFDTESFEKFMKFIMITFTVSILIYIVFPNCQELRPVLFERDNILTRFMTDLYQFDTNTNVCPSLHVIGSAAVMFSAWHSKHFNTLTWRIVFSLTALLISVSTVFLKQHSVLDVLAAIPICIIAYYLVYCRKKKNIRQDFCS